MPCYTQIVQTVELNVKTDADVLAKALRAEFGASVERYDGSRFRFSAAGATVYLIDGALQSNSLSERSLGTVADQVKQAYAVAVFQEEAATYGWSIEETTITETRRA